MIQSLPSDGLRILAVGSQGDDAVNAALQEIKRWAQTDGIEADTASDLPSAVRKLSAGRWDLVLIGLGERPIEELGWWTDALRAAGCATARRDDRVAFDVACERGRETRRARRARAADPPRGLRPDLLTAAGGRRGNGAPASPPEAEAAGRYSLIGQHPSMVEIYKLIARVAKSSATVLIEGESGTGKECVAREIHASSARAARPFVAVNCAAIPENLLESALFGHEKGAFTGAVTRKLGRFEYAEGGTLFLDELADMSLSLQAKILRAVQEREVERVGSSEVIPVDVRLIGATNKDLRAAVEQGKFREDLYYRLAVVSMKLPRLADRGDDLFLLTACCVHEFGARHGKQIDKVSSQVLELLFNHEWVGNVRELRNVIERAVILANGDTSRSEHLPDEFRGDGAIAPSSFAGAGTLTLADAERRHIALVLSQAAGQIGAAAQTLGIHRNTLARKMKEYGL